MRTEDPKKKKRRTVRDLMPATREDRITFTPEQSKKTLGLIGMLGAGATPGVGEAMDANDMKNALGEGRYGSAALSGLGLALPFVAMGGLKRVGGEVADAVKRPLIPWSKAPQEARDEYLNSLEGVRNPMRATDLASASRDPALRDALQPSLKNMGQFSAIIAALGLNRNRDR